MGRLENNVWISLGEGDDLLLLNSHLDVVPPSADRVPAVRADRRNGKVYGRGAVDAKASGAAMLWALLDLARSGWTTGRPPRGRADGV